MDARMISFWGCETNPCVNPDTANNGGGYSQPSGASLLLSKTGITLLSLWTICLAAISAAESVGISTVQMAADGAAVTAPWTMLWWIMNGRRNLWIPCLVCTELMPVQCCWMRSMRYILPHNDNRIFPSRRVL